MFSVEFSTYPFAIWSCAFLLYLLRVKTKEPQAGSFSKKKTKNSQTQKQAKQNTTKEKLYSNNKKKEHIPKEETKLKTNPQIHILKNIYIHIGKACLRFCHTDKLYESSRRKPG